MPSQHLLYPNRQFHRRAFTLVELLAVIIIIGVLSSLAFVALADARMVANRAKCASNMRQIGTALHAYANDHRGKLPPTSHSTGDNHISTDAGTIRTIEYSWIYQLVDYLGNVNEIRICPADEPERQDRIRNLNATSYLLNDTIFDAKPEAGSAWNYIHNIPQPSRTLWMFISNRNISRTWDHAHCADWTSWNALLEDVATDRHRVGRRSPERLSGSANYLYADAHVKSIKSTDLKCILDSGINPAAVPE